MLQSKTFWEMRMATSFLYGTERLGSEIEISEDDPAFAWPIARAYSEEAQAVQRHMDN